MLCYVYQNMLLSTKSITNACYKHPRYKRGRAGTFGYKNEINKKSTKIEYYFQDLRILGTNAR